MKFVAYYRCSTKKQGQSGLGLEAQQAAVEAYVRMMGATIIHAYTEVESGKRSDRPKLKTALGHAKMCGAKLIVAKLDRLSRNVAFLSALMESGVQFVCCDQPSANELTIHILVAVAQNEAKAISERTRAALAAYKARGGKLGSPHKLTPEASRKGSLMGAKAQRQDANKAYEFLYPRLTEMRQNGMTFDAIADTFNGEGLPTRRGKQWEAMTVLRACKRIA